MPDAAAAPKAGLQTLTFPVSGMTCAACQAFVQKTLAQTPGVESASVSLMLNSASVTYRTGETSPEKLTAAVNATGYGASLPPPNPLDVSAGREARELREAAAYRTLRTEAIATVSLGVAAMALMPWMHSSAALRIALLVVTALVMATAGRRFYVRGFAAARHGAPDMNSLIALGTGAAFAFSAAAALAPDWFRARGQMPDVYFEAVILILGLVLAGKTLEARAKRRTMAALESLVKLQPAYARVERGGREEAVALDQLAPGDILLIKPGERVAADGVVTGGASSADESMLTGESLPVTKQPADRVFSGTLNIDGALRVRVTAFAGESRLAQVVRLLRDAQARQAPVQNLADRVSRVFVPAVAAVAALTFAAWLLAAPELGVGRALTAAVSVLIIACPCAMGLAVPAAVMVATGRAAQAGVLIKSGDALERLSRVNVFAADKTGTLTTGRLSVAAFETLDGAEERETLALAAAVEAHSEHPAAAAIVAYARERGVAIPGADGFRAIPGRGVTGRVNGRLVEAGAAGFTGQAADRAGRIYVTVDGSARAAFTLRDTLKPDSARAVSELRAMGVRVVMLSGDSAETARRIAGEAGIDEVIAEAAPERKVEVIRTLKAAGSAVAMAGDGINDAAALAEADAGIAMGSGADVALESGDVALLGNSLRAVPWALALARQSMRVTRQNLFWAFLYNVLGIPVAAGALYPWLGWTLSPVLAAAAMALSSVSVLTNSLRLRNYRLWEQR